MTVERPHTVCARMTDDERAFVATVARSQNKTVSTLAREAILDLCRDIVTADGAGVAAAQSKELAEAEARLKAAREAVAENKLLKMAQSIDPGRGPRSN